jgi:hypothetical protein
VKRWWIAALAILLVGAAVVQGKLRKVTAPAYLEEKLSAAIASTGGVNRVQIGTSNFNLWRGTFTATGLESRPDTILIAQQTEAFGRVAATRYAITASSLRLDGVRVWPLLRGRIVADSAAVDSFRMDVYLDRTKGPSPPRKIVKLPHDHFQSIKRPFRIDAIRLQNATVSYSEKAVDGNRPGKIEFTDVRASVHNITNDSTRMTPSTPCTIDVRARVAKIGRLNATIGYDLGAPRLCMSYRGSVTRGSAVSLNKLLVALEGIRIRNGSMDSTWFDFQVHEDVARGKVLLLYNDLDFEMLDKVTGEKGLKEHIETYIADKKKLKDANPGDDDEPPVVVEVHQQRSPETKLPRFVWQTLREGLFTTLGIWREPET